ncbi:hypothetical protein CDAR_496351 [Caerostris darwini]|uniref:Uncharacterized protein n=1 Tax=Caerostris darwini TaxID=1538125 RepID=A0AAV4MU38_9ARAC|nr:hypothetical protein CDAR_496351 [Caerostris darwini]
MKPGQKWSQQAGVCLQGVWWQAWGLMAPQRKGGTFTPNMPSQMAFPPRASSSKGSIWKLNEARPKMVPTGWCVSPGGGVAGVGFDGTPEERWHFYPRQRCICFAAPGSSWPPQITSRPENSRFDYVRGLKKEPRRPCGRMVCGVIKWTREQL